MVLAWGAAIDPVSGQTITTWDEFTSCRTCELRLQPVVALGDEDGAGVIGSKLARVVASPDRGFLVFGQGGGTGHSVSLFDETGRFVRPFGREGDGPGETRIIADVAFADGGRIIVLDWARRRWISFRETGELLAEVPLHDVQGGRFRLGPGDTMAVMAVLDRRPATAGLPLHLVDLRDGGIIRHFGAGNRNWNTGMPFSTSLTLAESGRVVDAVWWGHVGRPHIEQWSVEGSHLATITGTLQSFPEAKAPPRDRIAPPPVVMAGFGIDGRNRLFMLTFVPGPRWRQVTREGPEGAIPADRLDDYQNLRLDVFDLDAKRHLGHQIWPEMNVTLVSYGDQILLSALEYETPLWPRLTLYEVEVLDDPG